MSRPLGNASKDLTGKRFGSLVIVGASTARKQGQIVWDYLCDCGVRGQRVGGNLKRTKAASCGCQTASAIRAEHQTHGRTNSFVYRVWSSMCARCHTPSSSVWQHYGGRGVVVCAQWRGVGGFAQFLRDVGEPPDEKHSIERLNVDGDYTPNNCAWISSKRQARNTRRTVRAPDGTAVVDLAEAAGLPHSTVIQRIQKLGWSLEEALSTPKTHNGRVPMPERPHSRRR